MQKLSATVVCAALGVTMLAGCSSNSGLFGNSLTTQSIGMASSDGGAASPTATPVANKIDPQCYSLAQRIDVLRKEGVSDRIEKASVGKSATVAVKRASLAQAAELDKANAEFQARCSTFGPRPIQASAGPAATGTVVAAAPTASSATVVSASAPQASVAPPVVVQQR
jgi:phage-related tail fiber protein